MEEAGEIPLEPDHDDRSSGRFDKWKSALYPGGISPRRKSRMLRLIFLGIVILLIYFLFFYDRAIHLSGLNLCSSNGECDGKLKLYDSYEIKDKYHEHAKAEKIMTNSNDDVFRVYARTTNNQLVSFNVTRSRNGGESGKDTHHYTLNCKNGGTCKISINCGENGKSCGCCCGQKDGCTCTGKCCNGENGCCSDGKKCCCCCFAQLVEAAILNADAPDRMTAGRVFFSLLPTILYLLVFMFLARGAAKGQLGLYGGKGGIFGIGKSISKTNKAKVTFKDVAGIKEEKEELEEIVDFLKRPKKYASMGARIPKGVILYGPPGTGKTLLAKAVSGESNVPFLEASGASFDDMFVGVGAKRVRELFDKAKKLSPCIIFIDEIDALAGKRGGKFNIQGNDQTINQLLSEMDGFNTQAGIIIIGATNRLESIDEAVLRPGRFDRHIQINLPDIAERREILKLHAKNKNLSNKIDLEEVARKTPGFSGAQLENVLNEAALLAVRGNKKFISTTEIDESIDRVMAGPAKKGRKILLAEKKQIAFHEAGHAIAGLYTDDGEIVEKITIIPRGKAAGYVLSVPKIQERSISTKKQLLSTIITLLSGRASEELFFGLDNISTGASNDLYKATQIARNIVLKFGMSNSAGMTQFIPSEEPENPYKNNYSETYARIIDDEVNKILYFQYLKAKKLIEDNKSELLLIVETLLLLETIDRNQIEFIHKYRRIPKEAEAEKERRRSQSNFRVNSFSSN